MAIVRSEIIFLMQWKTPHDVSDYIIGNPQVLIEQQWSHKATFGTEFSETKVEDTGKHGCCSRNRLKQCEALEEFAWQLHNYTIMIICFLFDLILHEIGANSLVWAPAMHGSQGSTPWGEWTGCMASRWIQAVLKASSPQLSHGMHASEMWIGQQQNNEKPTWSWRDDQHRDITETQAQVRHKDPDHCPYKACHVLPGEQHHCSCWVRFAMVQLSKMGITATVLTITNRQRYASQESWMQVIHGAGDNSVLKKRWWNLSPGWEYTCGKDNDKSSESLHKSKWYCHEVH